MYLTICFIQGAKSLLNTEYIYKPLRVLAYQIVFKVSIPCLSIAIPTYQTRLDYKNIPSTTQVSGDITPSRIVPQLQVKCTKIRWNTKVKRQQQDRSQYNHIQIQWSELQKPRITTKRLGT